MPWLDLQIHGYKVISYNQLIKYKCLLSQSLWFRRFGCCCRCPECHSVNHSRTAEWRLSSAFLAPLSCSMGTNVFLNSQLNFYNPLYLLISWGWWKNQCQFEFQLIKPLRSIQEQGFKYSGFPNIVISTNGLSINDVSTKGDGEGKEGQNCCNLLSKKATKVEGGGHIIRKMGRRLFWMACNATFKFYFNKIT